MCRAVRHLMSLLHVVQIIGMWSARERREENTEEDAKPRAVSAERLFRALASSRASRARAAARALCMKKL